MYLMLDEKIEIKVADTFHKKLIGFMGKKDFNYGILFPSTNSIHTYFMKEHIDVIGLNPNNEVIFKAVNVSKNKIITLPNEQKKTSILELPKNTSQKIKIGDILTFISE